MAQIALLLVDKHPYFRQSLGRLCTLNGLRIVGEAATGREALALSQQLQPDVVLLDADLNDMDSRRVAWQIQQTNPHIAIIFLGLFPRGLEASNYDSRSDWLFLAKDCQETTLLTAIQESQLNKDIDRPPPDYLSSGPFD